MASLNLSTNGASIKSSYAGVINGPAPASNSPTYAQWALFSVQAPLMNAFQDSGSKESVLKVQSTGDGELEELIEDFSEGRIQYAFVKVKDPNTGLPKYILVAWCGGGVPERTKGYFTSHTAAVSKVLHGYHVQITARSDSDLEPASIMQKVADASGAKYSAGSATSASAPAPPPVKTKPVFTPTSSSAGRSVNPIIAARSRRDENVDEDGWGADAPPVTRTQIEKVESAYKPTKVNLPGLTSQKQEPPRFSAPKQDENPDVVKGAYQPIGKVDIAAIRAQARHQADDKPTTVKGAYEPVGKVDIAAIRAKAQKPSAPEPAEEPEEPERSKPLADRAAAFSQPAQSERLTSMPKPKVANKFGGDSSFTGTKAPTPGGMGFTGPGPAKPAPIGAAGRTFADSAGKTPAQLWAEKKAKERGSAPAPSQTPESPVAAQKSGDAGWKSGYTGKSWATVQPSNYGRASHDPVSAENTGEQDRGAESPSDAPSGGVGSLKDRFKGSAPMGAAAGVAAGVAAGAAVGAAAAHEPEEEPEPSPPPVPDSSRPTGGFALPGLPSRPPPADEEEEEEDPSAYQPEERDASPVRIAVPVSRGVESAVEPPEERAPPPLPPTQIDVPQEEDLPDEQEQAQTARGAATAVAEQTFEPEQVSGGAAGGEGPSAVIQYDYEKGEENEIELIEGQVVTDIDMVDDDWWLGTDSRGERGLFPSNYVELIQGGGAGAGAAPEPEAAPSPPPAPVPAPAAPTPAAAPASASQGQTATALYDYEAAEDNEISFPEDAKITNIEFPDEDWWAGEYQGKMGLFPANYVQLDA